MRPQRESVTAVLRLSIPLAPKSGEEITPSGRTNHTPSPCRSYSPPASR